MLGGGAIDDDDDGWQEGRHWPAGWVWGVGFQGWGSDSGRLLLLLLLQHSQQKAFGAAASLRPSVSGWL